MKLGMHGTRLTAAGSPSLSDNPWRYPGPLGDTVQVIKDGGETVLINPLKEPVPTVVPTTQVVDQFCTDYKKNLLTGTGIVPELIDSFSVGVELMMLRIDAPATVEMLEAPANADTLLSSAFDAVMKLVPVLQSEDPSLLRNDDLAQLQVARDQIDGYHAVLTALDPLQHGALARKIQAQRVIDTFCRHVSRDGAAAIKRNRILTTGLEGLTALTQQPIQAAQDTKHLKAQVSHEVEAETLARVKEANANQGTPTPATGPGALQGAHAPGQSAVPPGAMPVPVLPVAKHGKPKRQGVSAPKKKSKP